MYPWRVCSALKHRSGAWAGDCRTFVPARYRRLSDTRRIRWSLGRPARRQSRKPADATGHADLPSGSGRQFLARPPMRQVHSEPGDPPDYGTSAAPGNALRGRPPHEHELVRAAAPARRLSGLHRVCCCPTSAATVAEAMLSCEQFGEATWLPGGAMFVRAPARLVR